MKINFTLGIVAQAVERETENLCVVGSTPTYATIILRKGQEMNNLQVRENEARQLIASQMGVLRTLTGKDEVKSSTFASAILAQVTNRNLINCSVDSIIKNGIEIVRLGLNPNPTFGQAYIVPFKTKNGGEIAQLQIGFKGFLNLAYRNGWIFRAVCVYTCDKFKIEFAGISDKITYEPNFEARQDDNAKWIHSNLIGVIVYAMDNQKTEFSEFVPFSKLEKLRLKSQNQNDKNELKYIWAEWSEEMYKAKALKYVATRLPITEQIQNAINSENAVYSENANLTQNNGFKTQNEAEVIETIDLNQIALNEPLKEQEIAEVENITDETKQKAFKVGYTGDKLKLFQFLTSEKGLIDDEAIGLIQQFAPTGTLAKALLENGERLENAISEYFKN